MSYTVKIPNGLVTMVETDFLCPVCQFPHTEDHWYSRYRKSTHCVIYMGCKGCKTKLGITTDIRGDVVVWLKSDEKEQNILT